MLTSAKKSGKNSKNSQTKIVKITSQKDFILVSMVTYSKAIDYRTTVQVIE